MDKSTIMDVPDKHNGRQQGDGLTWRCTRPGGDSFARPSAQGGATRGQIRTNEKETFNRRFFRCKQDYSHNLGLLNVHVSRPTAVWRAAQGS